MALPAMIPGESSVQYALRIGMDPNQASQMLTSGAMTGNTPQTFQGYLAGQAAPHPEMGWFGGPTVSTPVQFGPQQAPLDPAFYGGYGADAVSSASRGNISIPGVPNASPNLVGGWGNVQNLGMVPNPVAPYTGPYYAASNAPAPTAPGTLISPRVSSPTYDPNAVGRNPVGTSLNQIASGGGANSTSSNAGGGGGGGTPGQGGVNGVPGYGGTFDINNWQDPGYAFRLSEGMKALQNSAAASGGLLSGPTLKAITNYGQGAASQEYQNAFNRFMQNRQFNYGVDVGDRSFDYLTRTGDRDFNLQLANALTGQGQYGTSGGAAANNLLATLLSQNTLLGGQVAGQGTIGGANAITDAISRAISNSIQQGFLNRIGQQDAVAR